MEKSQELIGILQAISIVAKSLATKQAWVINELPGSKIAELEEGAYDENITTEI